MRGLGGGTSETLTSSGSATAKVIRRTFNFIFTQAQGNINIENKNVNILKLLTDQF